MQPEERRLQLKMPRPLWLGVIAVCLAVTGLVLAVWVPRLRALRMSELLREDGAEVELQLGWAESLPQPFLMFAIEVGNDLSVGDNLVYQLLETSIVDVSYIDEERRGREPDWDLLEQLEDLHLLGLTGMDVSDHDLAHIHKMPQLKYLLLTSTHVTGDSIPQLSEFKQLTKLSLGDCRLGKVSARLDLPDLVSLWLDWSDINDTNVEFFGGLTSLTTLYLGNTAITDNGLLHLRKLSRLYLLTLDGTEVSDAGLKHLEALKSLEFVTARATCVTEEGARRFVEAMPRAAVRLSEKVTVYGADYGK